MKIALVSMCENIHNHVLNFPIGLLEISDILDKLKIENRIIDVSKLACSNEDFRQSVVNEITDGKFDYVGFYTRCDIFPYVLSTCKMIKKSIPHIQVFLGGPEISSMPLEYMKSFEYVDIIFVGESELSIEEYFSAISKGDMTPDINGVAYRDGNRIFYKMQNKLIDNLDTLIDPNYDKLRDYVFSCIPIEIGRGCPYNCMFCSTSVFWHREYRFKSIKKIITQIRNYKLKYGVDDFYFIHDNILANRQNILSLCNELNFEKINIKWDCSGRIDNVDEEIIRLMKEAGCKSIYFGIETGSPNMQVEIRKRINLDLVFYNISILDKYNLDCIISFIIGFPNETILDVSNTFKMAVNLKYYNCVKYVQFHHLTINTGTRLYDDYKSRLVKNISLNNLSDQIRSDTGRTFNEYERDLITNNIDLFPSYHLLDSSLRLFSNTSMMAIYLMYISNNLYETVLKIERINSEIYKEIILELEKLIVSNNEQYTIDHKVIYELIKRLYRQEKYHYIKDSLLVALIHEKLFIKSDIPKIYLSIDNNGYMINPYSVMAKFHIDPFLDKATEGECYYLFCKEDDNSISHYRCTRTHAILLDNLKKGRSFSDILTRLSLPKPIINNIVNEWSKIKVLTKVNVGE